MLFILFKLYLFVKRNNLTVHTNSDVAVLSRFIENFDVFALFSSENRRENLNFSTLFKFKNLTDNLVDTLLFDCSSANRTMRNSYSRIKQPEIIVNLSHRADCGTWILRSGFLVNGNCGRKSVYAVNIGFFNLPQKHTCIRRKRLNISPSTLGINRIESKRGFS